MFRKKKLDPQASLWIVTSEVRTTAANEFYRRLDQQLADSGFGDAVRLLCKPFYKQDEGTGGRPGIDPVVFFKMQMVGFFEGMPSERAIASRCADSLSIREFLHYGLQEATPHHSSLTVIRGRLSEDVYEKVFGLVLKALKTSKLVKGKQLGIDGSVMEANAALRSLVNRLTKEEYAAYVRRLAEAEGVDVSDDAAVRRFDRKRPGRKTSNAEWQNPHDPDAKVGRTKRGATRMIHKTEHVVDLETGAILDADVRPGDEHDTAELTGRIVEVEARINRALGEPETTERAEAVVADKGYFKAEEIAQLQDSGSRPSLRIRRATAAWRNCRRWCAAHSSSQRSRSPQRAAGRSSTCGLSLWNEPFTTSWIVAEPEEPRCEAAPTSASATCFRRRARICHCSCATRWASGRRSRPSRRKMRPKRPGARESGRAKRRTQRNST